jgi:glycosyltransferase involved in cell wall biosynthesis
VTVRHKLGVVVPSYSRFIPSNPIRIAEGLFERGHEVELISTRGSDLREASYSDHAEAPARLPFVVRHAPYLGSFLDTVVSVAPPRDLPARYDALLLEEDYPLLCHEMARWARRRGVPLLLDAERYYYPPNLPARTLLRVFDRTLHQRLWRECRVIAHHSAASRRFLTEQGAPPDRFSFVPVAIDAVGFRELASKAPVGSGPSPTVRLFCVARLHPYKGLETLLQAMARLRDGHIDVNLSIHGRGPLENSLRTEIDRLGLGPRVTIAWTPVPQTGFPRLLRTSDIYVQPSLREPFGVAVLEAMAAGLPVVASATGGLLDTVVPGETGLLVPPGDAIALAGAIRELVGDPDLRRRMGARGQERAVNEFDYRKVAATYETLIERMLE